MVRLGRREKSNPQFPKSLTAFDRERTRLYIQGFFYDSRISMRGKYIHILGNNGLLLNKVG